MPPLTHLPHHTQWYIIQKGKYHEEYWNKRYFTSLNITIHQSPPPKKELDNDKTLSISSATIFYTTDTTAKLKWPCHIIWKPPTSLKTIAIQWGPWSETMIGDPWAVRLCSHLVAKYNATVSNFAARMTTICSFLRIGWLTRFTWQRGCPSDRHQIWESHVVWGVAEMTRLDGCRLNSVLLNGIKFYFILKCQFSNCFFPLMSPALTPLPINWMPGTSYIKCSLTGICQILLKWVCHITITKISNIFLSALFFKCFG